MDDVARRAGVGVGTLYRHFPTKEALMAELVRRKFVRVREAALEALSVEDPWEAFAGMLRRDAEMLAEDATMRDALARMPEAWATCEAERSEVAAVGAEVIGRAQAAGVLRPDFGADDIPMLMCGMSAAMGMPLDRGRDWPGSWRSSSTACGCGRLDGIVARGRRAHIGRMVRAGPQGRCVGGCA